MTCDRCKQKTISSSMSYFNIDVLCPECNYKEKAHPKYREAKEAELAAVKSGDYNYPGIGKPEDL